MDLAAVRAPARPRAFVLVLALASPEKEYFEPAAAGHLGFATLVGPRCATMAAQDECAH